MERQSRYSHFEEVNKNTFKPTGQVIAIPPEYDMMMAWQGAFAGLKAAGKRPTMSPFGGLIVTGRTVWKAVRVREDGAVLVPIKASAD